MKLKAWESMANAGQDTRAHSRSSTLIHVHLVWCKLCCNYFKVTYEELNLAFFFQLPSMWLFLWVMRASAFAMLNLAMGIQEKRGLIVRSCILEIRRILFGNTKKNNKDRNWRHPSRKLPWSADALEIQAQRGSHCLFVVGPSLFVVGPSLFAHFLMGFC